jgi:hypothetical protein
MAAAKPLGEMNYPAVSLSVINDSGEGGARNF